MTSRPRLRTLRSIAVQLEVSVFTVRRLVTRGSLPAVRLLGAWRVSEDALDRFLARGGVRPPR